MMVIVDRLMNEYCVYKRHNGLDLLSIYVTREIAFSSPSCVFDRPLNFYFRNAISA